MSEIIYFDYDKTVSTDTMPTVSRILDFRDLCKIKIKSITVTGRTETKGSASNNVNVSQASANYNSTVSQTRANNVKNELLKQGVDPLVITTAVKVESKPLVPAADDIKEPLTVSYTHLTLPTKA